MFVVMYFGVFRMQNYLRNSYEMIIAYIQENRKYIETCYDIIIFIIHSTDDIYTIL